MFQIHFSELTYIAVLILLLSALWLKDEKQFTTLRNLLLLVNFVQTLFFIKTRLTGLVLSGRVFKAKNCNLYARYELISDHVWIPLYNIVCLVGYASRGLKSSKSFQTLVTFGFPNLVKWWFECRMRFSWRSCHIRTMHLRSGREDKKLWCGKEVCFWSRVTINKKLRSCLVLGGTAPFVNPNISHIPTHTTVNEVICSLLVYTLTARRCTVLAQTQTSRIYCHLSSTGTKQLNSMVERVNHVLEH